MSAAPCKNWKNAFSPLDESIQTLQDQLHQTADATEQQLQELMNVAHEWLSAYERIMGHGKAVKKVRKIISPAATQRPSSSSALVFEIAAVIGTAS